MQIHPLETVLSLRQKIASRIGVTRPGNIRLITSGKELPNESNTNSLKKLRIIDRQVFMVMKRHTDGKNGQDSDKIELPLDEEVFIYRVIHFFFFGHYFIVNLFLFFLKK